MNGRMAPRTSAMDTFHLGAGVGERRYEKWNTTTRKSYLNQKSGITWAFLCATVSKIHFREFIEV